MNETIKIDANKTISLLPRPLFVVGMNGSGTTMLLDMLGRHSALYAFPFETRLIPYLMAKAEKNGDLNNNDHFEHLWEEVASIPAFVRAGQPTATDIPANWQEYPRTLASPISHVLSQLALDAGKQHWCEKTPQHVQHLSALHGEFPDARFIHVIRDGRDCAVSFHRRWLRSPILTIFRWKKAVQKGSHDGKQMANQYMAVRYEDLTEHSEQKLKEICTFLDLPFEDSILESSQPYLENTKNEANQAEQSKGLVKNSGKWQQYFSVRQRKSLEAIAGQCLAQFGYQVSESNGDQDLNKKQRKRLVLRDQVFQFSREIWLKISGKIERPWSSILAKPLNAIRQGKTNRY